MTSFLYPPALRPGDTVAVVAPSSPFEHVLCWRGLGFLAERYRVRFTRGLFSRKGYLAGTDQRRHDELVGALTDPEVRAVIAARGGYGASRFVHTLDWSLLREHPRWIVGFSDITALHAEAAAVGVASLHAPHVTMLGRSDARTREDFVRALEHPGAPRTYDQLSVLVEGQAGGVLVGGNLSLLHATATAGRLRLPERSILLIEDVTERPYRLDRMLATLIAGGHFATVRGIVVGDFTLCGPGPDGITVDEVLAAHLPTLGVPVVAGVPVGHDLRNDPVVLGAEARIEARAGVGVLRLSGPDQA